MLEAFEEPGAKFYRNVEEIKPLLDGLGF